jgi:elongation factor G
LDKLKSESKSSTDNKDLILAGIQVQPPVFFCSVEVSSPSDLNRLTYALKCLQREDPSLKVIYDDDVENTGQIVIQGMGELHLDIIKDRILKEYNLKIYFGALQIAYKEKPTVQIKKNLNFEKTINAKNNSVHIELTLVPVSGHVFDSVELIRSEENPFTDLSVDHLNAINHGIKSAFNSGETQKFAKTFFFANQSLLSF